MDSTLVWTFFAGTITGAVILACGAWLGIAVYRCDLPIEEEEAEDWE